MPSLVLFQRKTFIGGDDLQPTCFIAISLRMIQLIFLLLPILLHLLQVEFQALGTTSDVNINDDVDNLCYDKEQLFSKLLLVYFLSMSTYSIASMSTEYELWRTSGIGTPTQPQRRTQIIVKILERKLIPFTFFNLANFLLGAVTLFIPFAKNDDVQCQDDGNFMLFPFSNIFAKNIWRFCFLLMMLLQFFEVVVSFLSLLHIYSLPKIGSTPKHIQEILTMAEHTIHDLQQHNSYDVYQNDILWENRCRFWCKCLSFVSCYIFGGQELESGDYTDIARVLTDYFEHEGILDIVPSDIVAAFIVLQKKQRTNDKKYTKEVISNREIFSSSKLHNVSLRAKPNTEQTSPLFSHLEISMERQSHQHKASSFPDVIDSLSTETSNLSSENSLDLNVIAEGARFSRHALAIYTWVLYVYMKPLSGVCSLGSTRIRNFCRACSCCTKEGTAEVCDDIESNFYDCSNCTRAEANLIRQRQHIVGDNYCGLHKSALLAIAGLKDSELIYGQFEDGIVATPYCIILDHAWKSVVVSIRGTLSLEDCVVDVLVDAKSLEELGKQWNFDGAGEYCHSGIFDCSKWIMEDIRTHGVLDHLLKIQYPEYTLRIVGHSLGSGCAVLLSKMLRNQYPTLRCLSYSPPGGFCTYRTATECKDFVTSFILNTDLVPRLSIQNMEHLRDDILTIVGQINVPKINVIQSIFSKGNSWETFLEDIDQNSEYAQQLSMFKKMQQKRKSHRNQVNVSLFPPGKIVHLIKASDQTASRYVPIWAKNDDFDEILVSPTMGTDHFPNRVCLELEEIARSFGIDINLDSTFQ